MLSIKEVKQLLKNRNYSCPGIVTLKFKSEMRHLIQATKDALSDCAWRWVHALITGLVYNIRSHQESGDYAKLAIQAVL